MSTPPARAIPRPARRTPVITPTPRFKKLTLPQVTKHSLSVRVINVGSLPKEYMYPGELDTLVALMRRASPRRVMEIGCNSGRTSRVLLDHVRSIEKYIGVDVLPGYRASYVQRNETPAQPGRYAKDDPRFELVLRKRGSFDLATEDIRELAPFGVDAVFIDGDHGAAAVQHDTDLALSVLNGNGMIVWHDYHDLHDHSIGVRCVLDELYLSGVPLLHVEGTWLVFWIKGGV